MANSSLGTVLVTGGAGYIGSHFVALLADRGVPYVVIDNLSRSSGSFVDPGHLVSADIADHDAVVETCVSRSVRHVVHFAAYAYVGESVEHPALYYENNVVKTFKFVQALRSARVNSIVFSSTCATYGTPPENDPIVESLPQNPINPYGQTKLMIEKMLTDFSAAYGMRAAFLRYFNAAGSSSKHPLYEAHDPETHAIPLALRAALQGGEFVVFGDDFDTPDGTCIRDFIHVDDLADAHIRAMEHIERNPGVLAVNLGTGRGTSVKEIVESVARVTGRDVPHRVGPRRAGDPPVLVANPTRAKEILSWSPRYVEIDDIIRTAYEGMLREAQAL